MIAVLVCLSLSAVPATDATQYVRVADPSTRLAIELMMARVELTEKQTLLQSRHPEIRLGELRVGECRRALRGMRDGGKRVDQAKVDAELNMLIERARAKLVVARKIYSQSHPQLALLELRLHALAEVAARRSLED